jgi:hypothetical protein
MTQEQGPIELTGGCQCGAVRYRARAATSDAYYCHCRMCQRALGNVSAAFVNVKKIDVAFERGQPTYYASSKFARRGFCRECGTPLSFEYVARPNMDLTVGSLDHPERVRPTSHFGVESRLAAFHKPDALPEKRTEDAAHIVAMWKEAYGDDAVPGPRPATS